MAKIPIPTHVKLVNGLGNDQRKKLIEDATTAFTKKEATISKPDTSGFGHIRENVIGPSEESVDNKWKNFVNWAKEYKQSTSNTTQPLQSGPISANDFAAMSGSNNIELLAIWANA